MKKLTKFFDYKVREKEIATSWKESGVYKFLNKKPTFKIDTPPPTVSGLLHMGHVFSYVQADIIARYKRQMGFDVFYPVGFDDNGLPTERLVEKITGKKVGRNATKEEFIAECFTVVGKAEEEFEELFSRVGLSMDFSLKYQTISEKTSEISQNSFIDLWNKGLIYQKLAPVYWDTVDKTALAQADIEERVVDGFQVNYTALIELEGEKFEKVEIMTTRAEMISACVAVLCHPEDVRYLKFAGKKVILPCRGEEFLLEVPLIADMDVVREKGTGLVMCCAFGDMQDKIWIERHNLWSSIPTKFIDSRGMPSLVKTEFTTQNIISDDGFVNDALFAKEDGKFMKAEDARRFIIEKMLKAGIITGSSPDTSFEDALANSAVKLEAIMHAIKCAERSGKAVEIVFKNQWYLSLLPFKKDFLEVVKKINFNPSHMKIRLEHWIEGLNQDWCISRDRFFGIGIPVHEFEFKDNVSRETLESIKNDFYNEALKPLIKKIGGLVHETHFEMESESVGKMMETPEYLSFEDSFILSGLDLEIKNIGIRKYSVEIHRNVEGVFAELLNEFQAEINDGQFILKDKEIKKLAKVISEKKEIFEEMGIESLVIKNGSYVLDTWFTSSLSPQIAWGHLMECPVFDLRPQAHEIIRTWAFYTVAKTYLHSLELKSEQKKPDAKKPFNSREFFRMKENPNIIPWKDVMLSGWCLAADKTKMSKSKDNVITPTDLICEKGVDVIRLWCSSTTLGTDVAYSEETLESGKKFINKLWNAFKFFELKKEELVQDAEITENFDKWIVARLDEVIVHYVKHMNAFEYSKAKDLLDSFFWNDLCNNYLEIIKVRYYGINALIYKENPPKNPSEVIQKQQSALKALSFVLEGILILYAPFTPFITDDLSNAFFGSSVHKMGSIVNFLIPKFNVSSETHEALKIIEAVRKYKTEHSLAMNTIIEEFSFKLESDLLEYKEDLKNVTGVKHFNFN